MALMTRTFALNENVSIPAVGFGTYLISSEDAPQAIQTAIECGYRHIDTASGYRNETAVGEGIAAGLASTGLSREDIFVTAKLWPGNSAWGDAPKTHEQTLAECDASLERLGLDYVDLYLIHAPYGGPERLSQWRALGRQQRERECRAVAGHRVLRREEIATGNARRPLFSKYPFFSKVHLIPPLLSKEGIEGRSDWEEEYIDDDDFDQRPQEE